MQNAQSEIYTYATKDLPTHTQENKHKQSLPQKSQKSTQLSSSP
jgi:hypothetical protein